MQAEVSVRVWRPWQPKANRACRGTAPRSPETVQAKDASAEAEAAQAVGPGRNNWRPNVVKCPRYRHAQSAGPTSPGHFEKPPCLPQKDADHNFIRPRCVMYTQTAPGKAELLEPETEPIAALASGSVREDAGLEIQGYFNMHAAESVVLQGPPHTLRAENFKPDDFVGSWWDSWGNTIHVSRIWDRFGNLKIKAVLQRPSRPNATILAIWRAAKSCQWHCGNACLDVDASCPTKLVWRSFDSRVSEWSKQHEFKSACAPLEQVSPINLEDYADAASSCEDTEDEAGGSQGQITQKCDSRDTSSTDATMDGDELNWQQDTCKNWVQVACCAMETPANLQGIRPPPGLESFGDHSLGKNAGPQALAAFHAASEKMPYTAGPWTFDDHTPGKNKEAEATEVNVSLAIRLAPWNWERGI